MTHSKKPEETLNPENWDDFSQLGHKMLDDIIQHLKTVDSKTHRLATKEESAAIYQPLLKQGYGEQKTYEDIMKNLLPSVLVQNQPKWWGWVIGGVTPYGMLVDMIKSGFNLNGDDQASAAYDVNKQALTWVKELLGYPLDSSGVFVTGGSEANFTGLAVARNAMSEVNMKEDGLQSLPHKMTLYVSEEGHHSLERNVELLGLGNKAFRWIKTDDDCRINLGSLRRAIAEDRKMGYKPFCVIGCAGTVNSGAFDDLNVLADLAEKEKMWLHVDGAFGAWVRLSDTHKHLADGLERADSVAFDLHKWMSMPYGIGCTLVRHSKEHLRTFVYGPEAKYIDTLMDGIFSDLYLTSFLSIRLSNEFTPLKAYMLLRAYGSEKYARIIQQNLDQISYLEGLIRAEPYLEVTAPVASNIVCFRYNPGKLPEAEVEALNREILKRLWEIDFGVISDTTIKGRYMLRACNVNHRTRREDFDWLVSEVKKIGDNLLEKNHERPA